MDYKDYYKILGVKKDADEKTIKKRYRELARKYHPDKNPGDDAAEEKFKEINEAYEVLGTPENRSKYDQLGANYQRFRQMGGNTSGFDFSQYAASGGYQNVDLNDMFGGQSGGFSDFFSFVFGQQGRAQPVTGRNVEHEVAVTLEEAYHGTSRTLVREDGERFTAKIPRGVATGNRIRLRGKGGKGSAGPGDLFLVIKVLPHRRYKRDGRNLRVDLPVSITTAVLGGKLSVDTLSGPVTLTIPAGTQGGQTIRLTGRGMPVAQSEDRYGDLLANVTITVPVELSPEEQVLYEKLADIAASRQRAQA